MFLSFEGIDGARKSSHVVAARKELLESVIEPALARGVIVVSDRFHDSTYTFQGSGRGFPREKIEELDAWVGGVRPDVTLYFDVDVKIAAERIAPTRALDRFERERAEFHDRVRRCYLSRTDAEPGRFVVVVANRSINEARQSVLDAVVEAKKRGYRK